MAVAKRKRREKPAKIEQRKVWGPEWGPQVKQTALLASPVYTGQAWGRRRNIWKEKPKFSFELLFSCLLCRPTLTPRGCVSLCLTIKLSYNTGPSVTSNFCCCDTELRKLHTALTYVISLVLYHHSQNLKQWMDQCYSSVLQLSFI